MCLKPCKTCLQKKSSSDILHMTVGLFTFTFVFTDVFDKQEINWKTYMGEHCQAFLLCQSISIT
jgi:hypothetical protein